MAKAPTSAPDAPKTPGGDPNFKPDLPASIEPEAMYEVTLWKSVKFAGRTLRPNEKIDLSGAALESVKDSVLGAAKKA